MLCHRQQQMGEDFPQGVLASRRAEAWVPIELGQSYIKTYIALA